MVKVRKPLPRISDEEIDIERWLSRIHSGKDNLIREAVFLSRLAGEDYTTPYGNNCFEESLEIAEIIAELNLGQDAIAAALVFSAVEHAELTLDDIEEQLGKEVCALVLNVKAMQSITRLEHNHGRHQIDNIRKMLLAMVRDVRAVVIKLAERLCVLRAIHHASLPEQKRIAHETEAVYAPLASRLGISELKWELEDLAFSILHRDIYKTLANNLHERRIEREARVQLIISRLQQALSERNIEGQVAGRAKHIFSIYKKMERKQVPFSEIYDAIAVRVLVPKIDDCYAILSFAHKTWQAIQEEFDDYIHTPKPNGYQSIHTAVKDANDKVFELQIRTHQMHEESEMGVAAHWLYKEGARPSGYEEKIKWLRQLLEWQKEMSEDSELPSALERNVFQDRVYVFTPEGKIIDLPQGATPLDFAYHVHTEVGHRCRGAKVNGKIVPLTYALQLSDTVDIITTKQAAPSRDWMLPQRGYLKTPRARAKVLHWFKQQDQSKHIESGKTLLEQALSRLHLPMPNLDELSIRFNQPDGERFLAALGHGDLRLAPVLTAIQGSKPKKPELESLPTEMLVTKKINKNDIYIYGIGDLLTHIAQCCKPIPNDEIIGYITQGHGVTIHRQDCKNAAHLATEKGERLIEVTWAETTHEQYPVTLSIEAYDRTRLLSDITQVVNQEKVSILAMNTHTDKKTHTAFIRLTIEIADSHRLNRVIERINLIPNVKGITRDKNQQQDEKTTQEETIK